MATINRLLLTIEEAADRLSLGRTTTYGLVNRGDLASVKIGKSRRITVDALERYVQNLKG